MFPQPRPRPQHRREMFRHVEAEEGREPQDRGDCDGCEEELGVVQEGKRVVTEEGDDEVVV